MSMRGSVREAGRRKAARLSGAVVASAVILGCAGLAATATPGRDVGLPTVINGYSVSFHEHPTARGLDGEPLVVGMEMRPVGGADSQAHSEMTIIFSSAVHKSLARQGITDMTTPHQPSPQEIEAGLAAAQAAADHPGGDAGDLPSRPRTWVREVLTEAWAVGPGVR